MQKPPPMALPAYMKASRSRAVWTLAALLLVALLLVAWMVWAAASVRC